MWGKSFVSDRKNCGKCLREPAPGGGSLLSQTAFFAPRGLAELLYWYTLYPIHALIFSGLVKRLARNAAGSRP